MSCKKRKKKKREEDLYRHSKCITNMFLRETAKHNPKPPLAPPRRHQGLLDEAYCSFSDSGQSKCLILDVSAGEEPADVLVPAALAPPASPDTERCPAGPSTEPGSCRSGRVRSGGACKRQTQPSVSSVLRLLLLRLGCGFELTLGSWGNPRTRHHSRANGRGRSRTRCCFPLGLWWGHEWLRGFSASDGGLQKDPLTGFTLLACPPWAAGWGCLSSGGGGDDDSAMKRSPSVGKKTGEDGSRLAPPCRWIRPGHFLGAEKEAGVQPQQQRRRSEESVQTQIRWSPTCRRTLLVTGSCLENLPQNRRSLLLPAPTLPGHTQTHTHRWVT